MTNLNSARGFIQDLSALNPSRKFFPLHETRFDKHAVVDVTRAISDGNVSALGPELGLFENGISQIIGSNYTVCVGTGTAALHLALHALHVSVDDEVLIPTCTFVATVNAVLYTGATPVFVDSEEDDLGMDPSKLKDFLHTACITRDRFTYNKSTGRRVSTVVIMHALGNPARAREIRIICDDFNLLLIEDAAESLGSFDGKIHTGLIGHVGVVSFNGNKILTTGNGGAVVTNDEELAIRVRHIASTSKLPHKWEFNHDQLGWNYRLPNLNAALGLSQISNFQNTLAAKETVSQIYREVTNRFDGVTLIEHRPGTRSNHWLNAIRIPGISLEDRNTLIQEFHEVGFSVRPLWNLMHGLNFLDHYQKTNVDNAEKHLKEIICLPSSGYLSEELIV